MLRFMSEHFAMRVRVCVCSVYLVYVCVMSDSGVLPCTYPKISVCAHIFARLRVHMRVRKHARREAHSFREPFASLDARFLHVSSMYVYTPAQQACTVSTSGCLPRVLCQFQ